MLCRGPAPRPDDVFEHLRAEDFHVPAHRMIFGATRRLYDDNQPIDTVTMVDKLHRGGEPDQAGGASFSWSGSGMRHPSAANVGYYTHVMEEHAPRRGMLKASRQSTELATNLDTEVDAVLDQAEQRMPAVANDRAGEEPHDGGPSTTAVCHQRCDRYWPIISPNGRTKPRTSWGSGYRPLR